MTMAQEKQGLDKFLDWASKQPASSPEERANAEEERKALEGTMNESAMMLENADIAVRTWGYSPGGAHGHNGFTISPSDNDYERAKQQYGLNKPGDKYSVVKKWINGNWVVHQEQSGKAKSA